MEKKERKEKGPQGPNRPRPKWLAQPNIPRTPNRHASLSHSAADTRAPHVRSLPHSADTPTPPVSRPLPQAVDRPEHGVALVCPILPKP
jgi:hypothetical protein